jgi:RNA polymerase sigma-70 factor (ECF subfamily)
METPASLLERLRQPAPRDAWERFVKLYTPLLFAWAHRAGLRHEDAADLVQDVFATLVEKLPTFSYDGTGSFRAWLRTLLMNRWRNRLRRPAPLPLHEADAAVPAGPDPIDLFEQAEYRQCLVHRALELMQTDFRPSTWKAFWEHVVVGRPAAEVGRELGLSANSVYVARVRVLTRLREELAGLVD